MTAPDPELYLDRAKQDIKAAHSNVQQGFYNVALSRAYYAMFYAATALLASKDITRSKHTGVISAFGEHFVKAGIIEVEYAKMLGHAYNARIGSDYDIMFVPDRLLAEEVIDNAKRFVRRTEELLEQDKKV